MVMAVSEATNQGNSQVSSFGFGGTNAHGIFWGQNVTIKEERVGSEADKGE